MDVFDLQKHVVDSYESYVKSFYQFKDPKINAYVTGELEKGRLWPQPLIQLNPSFAQGASVTNLVQEGLLDSRCAQIFARDSHTLKLYKHQEDAIRVARQGKNYVLTTGTGSGKSLSYIIPVVDHVLREGSGKGIRAVIVYPMNALANSQIGELEKFLGKEHPQVTFKRYTGQESDPEKEAIRNDPPDILLTNYVMLEYIFSRIKDSRLVDKMRKTLRFVVLDELHTYRGRQGADVAMLMRRVRCMLDFRPIQMVGTSATMGGGKTWTEKQERVAVVASKLFGQKVTADAVIGETLVRATSDFDPSEPVFRRDLIARVTAGPDASDDYYQFIADPLASWIETTLGICKEEGSGRWIRTMPRSIYTKAENGSEDDLKGCADELSVFTGLDRELCADAIRKTLLQGNQIRHPSSERRVFAFRLHQFVSKGETVYATLEKPGERQLTLDYQQFASADRKKNYLPLSFCRNCGQEYYVVNRVEENGGYSYVTRELNDLDKAQTPGYLYLSPEYPWPERGSEEFSERLPSELDTKDQQKYWPENVFVAPDGATCDTGEPCTFVKAPLKFCLHCGMSYSNINNSEYPQLTQLASDGRSTATTVFSLSAVSWLRKQGVEDIPKTARKILSFTDNRQDAALQAGHFNDFISIGLMRAGLYKALNDAPPEGLRYEELAANTFKALALDITDFGVPDRNYNLSNIRRSAETALKEVLAYKLITDLRRGWRITMPNLENCGLVEIVFDGLDELCGEESVWQDSHKLLQSASPKTRRYLLKTLLDHLRKSLCIDCPELDPDRVTITKAHSRDNLKSPWALDDNEYFHRASWAWKRSKVGREEGCFVTAMGTYGKFLGRSRSDEGWTPVPQGVKLGKDDKTALINCLFAKLLEGGLLKAEDMGNQGMRYQIPPTVLVWQLRDGTKRDVDPLVNPTAGTVDPRPNPFFVEHYRTGALAVRQMEAREHTAQVDQQDRQLREALFRSGDLPVMYCSPTMELGVDISDLNVVGMRNVPPTPANYAQRSGRAGRSGQPALVIVYCTTGSAHDQYFFRRMGQMVAGEVATPQLELANEDLVRSHLHAIWLFEAHIDLKRCMSDILDLQESSPNYMKLAEEYRLSFANTLSRNQASQRILSFVKQARLNGDVIPFLSDAWVDSVVNGVRDEFDRSCDRWRNMLKAAKAQMDLQTSIIKDVTRSRDHDQAKALLDLAVDTHRMLTTPSDSEQSDFYPYRYFASEGFLPGYNFPRLPITAYIGQSSKGGNRALSRPRFLAISEFGPHSLIYHEGARYQVKRVLLPINSTTEGIPTQNVKVCGECGYLNPDQSSNVCDHCGQAFSTDDYLTRLFKMETVVAQRVERITADEEERQRKGYELRTAVCFAQGDNAVQTADVVTADGNIYMTLSYGATATIWRINIGLRMRKNKNEKGFGIDVENGRWIRSKDQVEREGPQEGEEDERLFRREIVLPYVEDRRNCLLVSFTNPLDEKQMASLQAALKTAVQAVYQLEDNELAAEPLPDADHRNILLFYESAEGGAGVLRQLVSDAGALSRIADAALEICHFDKVSGQDNEHAPGVKEPCRAACYNCLMSYTNQLDHDILDRFAIKDELLKLRGAEVRCSPGSLSREDHYLHLMDQCESLLEKRWLTWAKNRGLRLPNFAQHYLPDYLTRPDFLYEISGVRYAIYVDGPVHGQDYQTENDRKIDDRLENGGIMVLRFREGDDWDLIAAEHESLFGIIADGGITA